MLILGLLLTVIWGIGFCLFMYNCEITNKFGAVGAALLFISSVLQLLIKLI